ncbi:winged helix-turn-helix domain-containing protein [Adhaeribacter radiodurans]|uniref:LysR family transcriptional regulator n=1 Tax=Adhaeribacter radiodurans TaxID=2745197 RepID=A0A7L7L502_9BACT|nr:winged helix-turn-helix domain-containing protein [Adhaeribacter radiodurans]QMU27844.1 LysR family transcriptional regulator [Adhaeribacter radiodurans]
MTELFSPGLNFRVNGRLWIESEDDRFLGPGRIELLHKIQESGSISKAATAMGMSYRKAWDLVASMNQQAATPLVMAQIGGKKGGGALVTEVGQQAILRYSALQERFQAFLQTESQNLSQTIPKK